MFGCVRVCVPAASLRSFTTIFSVNPKTDKKSHCKKATFTAGTLLFFLPPFASSPHRVSRRAIDNKYGARHLKRILN